MITIQDFQAKTNDIILFKSVNVEINDGDCIIIQGDNGIGKSTLLKILAHLHHEYYGKITIHHDIPPDDYITLCHYLSHDMRLPILLTCQDIITLWKNIYEVNNNHNLISDNMLSKRIGFLSHGEKQRLLLTKLQLIKRHVWFLDEMDNGLDKATYNIYKNLISNHCQNSGIVVMISHRFNRDSIITDYPINNSKIINLEPL